MMDFAALPNTDIMRTAEPAILRFTSRGYQHPAPCQGDEAWDVPHVAILSLVSFLRRWTTRPWRTSPRASLQRHPIRAGKTTLLLPLMG